MKLSRRTVQKLATIGCLVGLVASSVMSVWHLRQNNLKMVELRRAVEIADQNDRGIEDALRELRDYVRNHMNTNLRARSSSKLPVREKPIQLIHKYYRDTLFLHQQTVDSIGDVDNIDALKIARQNCETNKWPIAERMGCVQKITRQRGNDFYPKMEAINKDYYVFNFPSPGWTPDTAGWSLVGCGLFLTGLFGTIIWRL